MKQCLRFRIRKLVCEFAMSVSWRLKESQLTICWQESWYIKIQLEKRHMKQRRRMGISARQPMVLGAVAASSKPHKCQCVRRLEHLDPKGLGHYSSQIGSVWKWSVPQRLPFWHILTYFDWGNPLSCELLRLLKAAKNCYMDTPRTWKLKSSTDVCMVHDCLMTPAWRALSICPFCQMEAGWMCVWFGLLQKPCPEHWSHRMGPCYNVIRIR
jgi:hypothetical protein